MVYVISDAHRPVRIEFISFLALQMTMIAAEQLVGLPKIK